VAPNATIDSGTADSGTADSTSAESGTAAEIERFLAEATPDAAARLGAIARAAGKDERKAARRALYLLSQRGVMPANESDAAQREPENAPPRDALRVWASAYDGAGNRLFLAVLASSEGGSSSAAQLIANDELGIREFGTDRKRPREIEHIVANLEGRIDEGLVVAEIEPDYARQCIEGFRAINQARFTRTPAGFVEFHAQMGSPPSQPMPQPVHAALESDTTAPAESVPADPGALFKLPWFEPWFFAAEDMAPWLARWIEIDESTIAGAEKIRGDRQRAIVLEVATALFDARMRSLYIVRLEESADVLRRRGRITEARQAMLHAKSLKEDRPAAEIPFCEAIAARTLEAAAEMIAARRKQAVEASQESK